MVIEERNIALSVVLYFVTCGIYGLYWVYNLTIDMKKISGDDSLNEVLAVILPLVTCNLYGLYWNYKVGKDVPAAKARVGLNGEDKSILLILFSFLGWSVVSYAILQNELNEIAKAQNPVQSA